MGLDDRSDINLVPLATFTWGEGGAHVARYCRWDEGLVLGGNAYASCPELEVVGPDEHGGTADNPFTVTLRRTRSPLDRLLRPYPHAPISVLLEEVDPDQPTTRRTTFTGRVSRSLKNLDKQRELGKLTVAGIREGLQYSLGVMVETGCSNIFADGEQIGSCGIMRAGVSHAGTVGSISGVLVTVTGLAVTTDDYYAYGSVEVDGLAIFVVSNAAGVMRASREPPPEWVGAACVCVGGCDRSIERCGFWSNTHRFNGIGIRIPDYHPMGENPGGAG